MSSTFCKKNVWCVFSPSGFYTKMFSESSYNFMTVFKSIHIEIPISAGS